MSDELPGVGDFRDPLIVGPFESQEQLEAFLEVTGRLWRSDGADVYTPEEYLNYYADHQRELESEK